MFLIFFQIMIMEVYQIHRLNVLAVLTLGPSVHFSPPFLSHLHMLVLQPVRNSKIAVTNSSMMAFDAGGNFVMTTYSCISVYHFQRYCSGSGNRGDCIYAVSHCMAVWCSGRTYSCNAPYLGDILCDSECFLGNKYHSIAIFRDSLEYSFHHFLLTHAIRFQKEIFEGNLPFIPPNIIILWVRSVSTNTCNW